MTCSDVLTALDDYVDGAGLPAERAAIAAHLATCAGCAAEERALRALLAAAAALPLEVAPPSDLWPAIEGRLRGAGALPAWPRYLAAAACLAFAVLAGVSLRGRSGTATGPASPAGALQPAALEAAAVQQLERDYEKAAGALLAQLRARQSELPPQTLAQVEESLRTIDSALAEIRAALHEQPSETGLHLLLAATYRKKVDVLKKVVEIGA